MGRFNGAESHTTLLQRKVQRLEAELKGKDLMLNIYEKTVFQNRCETCTYYQEGEQPDGILWQSCDHDFECANIYEFHYKAKDEIIKECYTCKHLEAPCGDCNTETNFLWEAKDE